MTSITVSHRPPHPRGFSLVEMLITMGIIVLIAGIALPMINIANRKGRQARIKSDFAMIDHALNAYKDEFGSFPTFPSFDADANSSGASGNGLWLDYSSDRGARLLCFALMSVGDAGDGIYANPGQDGADGAGFRTRRQIAGGGYNGTLVGKIHPPFIESSKFKIEYSPSNNYLKSDAKMLDVVGNPILYYPAAASQPLFSVSGGYVNGINSTNASGSIIPYFNAYDNLADTSVIDPSTNQPKLLMKALDLAVLLGDRDKDGKIDNGEQAAYTGPYMLWSAGTDGVWGLDANGKTSNVANFDLPAGLTK